MSSGRVTWHDGEDPGLAVAAQAARATFRYCWREVAWDQRRIVPALDLAAVKVAFAEERPDGDPIVEHLWAAIGAYDGTSVAVQVMNDPIDLSGPAAGTELDVPLTEVEDWLYVRDGKAYGAHTVQVLRAQMGRRERKQHDRAWGLDFGDPEKVRLDEAVEHPMALSSEETFRSGLLADPDLVTVRDERGWTLLHGEAVAGNATMVRLLLEQGADPEARTPDGETALELARRTGWEHVVVVLEQP